MGFGASTTVGNVSVDLVQADVNAITGTAPNNSTLNDLNDDLDTIVVNTAVGLLEDDIETLEDDVETLETAVEANTTAVGTNSTALGTNSTAVGTNSTALGTNTTAAGLNTTAVDSNTTAAGLNTTAVDSSTTAIGLNTTAVSDADAAVDALTTAVGTLETDITSLEADIETLETAVEANTAASSATIGSAMTSVDVNEDAGGPNELIATPGAGHALWIYGYELHANLPGTFQLLSATTDKTGIMPIGALGGPARDSVYPIFKCAENEALNLTTVTCAMDGIITYRDVTL